MSRYSSISDRHFSTKSSRTFNQPTQTVEVSRRSTLPSKSKGEEEIEGREESPGSDEEQRLTRQRLTRSVGILDSVLKDLIEYKLDALSAATVANKLVQPLRNEGAREKVVRTLTFIHNLARNQASRHGLLTCPPIIRELIRLLQTTPDVDLQAEVALCLQLLAKTGAGAEMIGDEFGIPVLVKLLSHPSEVIYTTALYLLNQLMWHFPDEMRPRVRDCQGHLAMTQLLAEGRLNDVNWLVICVDSIRMTVYGSDQTKLAVLQTDLHPNLIRLLRTYIHNPKMAYNTARLIKVLGTCNRTKVKLVENGAVEALACLLDSNNHALVLEALWGLRNISDRAYHLKEPKDTTIGLIPTLIDLLGSRDENISICAAGCLCNLTCQNAQNKQVLVQKDGVKSLCHLLMLNHARQEIAEPVCSALRHVSHRNENADFAVYEIRVNKAIPTIALVLRECEGDSKLPLLKSVTGLILNLAGEQVSREQLKVEAVPKSLLQILRRLIDRVNHVVANSDPKSGYDLGYIEGVSLEGLIEVVLLALQAMAADKEVQDQLIHTAGCITTLVQILHQPLTSLQRAASAVLSELSLLKDGAVAIEREGACPRLTELIQSENEYIAGYSAAVLHRITRDKPAAYRQRLYKELRQALFDGGLVEPETDPRPAAVAAPPKTAGSNPSTAVNEYHWSRS